MCGRETGGIHVNDLGVCPAATEERLNGIHGGVNGGRVCWIITGTLFNGEKQGIFINKYKDCGDCGFYTKVKDEEFPEFNLSATLLRKINCF